MSDGVNRELKNSIIQSTEGNKHMQIKNERELRYLGTESCLSNSNESGGKREFSIYSRLFTKAVVEKELLSYKI